MLRWIGAVIGMFVLLVAMVNLPATLALEPSQPLRVSIPVGEAGAGSTGSTPVPTPSKQVPDDPTAFTAVLDSDTGDAWFRWNAPSGNDLSFRPILCYSMLTACSRNDPGVITGNAMPVTAGALTEYVVPFFQNMPTPRYTCVWVQHRFGQGEWSAPFPQNELGSEAVNCVIR